MTVPRLLVALVALVLGCATYPGAAAASKSRYRGFEDQNQRVRLVYDREAERVAFRIGYIAHCVGTGGESEGDEGPSAPLVAKPPNGARVRVARDGAFEDRFRFRIDRTNNRDGIGPDELHRRIRIAIAGQIEGRRHAHGTIRVRYTEVRINHEVGVDFRFESSCDSDVRQWRTPRFDFTGPWRPTGPVPLGDPELLLALTNGQLLAFGGNDRENQDPPRAVTYRPARDRWRRTEPPAHARRQPAAVVLGDGRVLVAGGSETTVRDRRFADRTLRAAELYNPRTRRWTPTSPLTLKREGALAQLLPDGRVLIVGGTQGPPDITPTAEAEIFDPETRRFTHTAAMPSALNPLYCAALPSGGILCLGDDVQDGSEVAVVFDPVSETWGPVDVPPEIELFAGVIALEDGRILATGRTFEGDTPSGAAAIFTQGVGWAAASPPPALPLFRSGGVLLPAGRVLVPLQETEPGDLSSQRAATYDPATDTWEYVAPYFHPYTQYPYLAATEDGALVITDGPTALTRTERFFE